MNKKCEGRVKPFDAEECKNPAVKRIKHIHSYFYLCERCLKDYQSLTQNRWEELRNFFKKLSIPVNKGRTRMIRAVEATS